ncbi:MAG: outer membrane lipoprotein carrier protein LolA [Candidatus Hydrogenedentota bacterium]
MPLLRVMILPVFFACMYSATAQDVAPDVPAPDVQEVFRLFSEERDEIQSMQARFTQMTMTPDEDIASEGSIVYVNPKRIIFRYDESDSAGPITYMIDQSNAYEFDEELEQILVYDIEGRPEADAFFLGLDSDSKQVQEAYDMKLLPAENFERDAFALELVPIIKDDIEPIFQKVTLQLRKGDFLPTEIYIINDEDSNVLFKLSGFVLNEDLACDRSNVFVPENTDVVIDDIALDPVGKGGRFFPSTSSEEDEDLFGDE